MQVIMWVWYAVFHFRTLGIKHFGLPHLNQSDHFLCIDSIDSGFVWRASKMPSSSQEETTMPYYLVLLAICLMDWLFGDQVSWHTLLLGAEVTYVNNHLNCRWIDFK